MEIIYWNKKVNKFIEDLDWLTSSRVIKTINALEKYGNDIGMPDSKALGKGLFELRTVGSKHIRIIYTFHAGRAYLIHCFIKKAWKINIRDISYARSIQMDIIRLV